MPVEIYEDSIDIHIDLLDALPETGVGAFPKLALRKEQETRRFRCINLENEYLCIKFVPALGGRLWSLFDKRAGRDVCATPGEANLMPGGVRGVELVAGALLRNENHERENALGNVDSQLIPPGDESEAGSVLLSEVHSGSPLTNQVRYTLSPGSACLRVEVTVQNRTLDYVPYNLNCFATPCSDPVLIANGVLSTTQSSFLFDAGTFVGVASGFTGLLRRPEGSFLGPRQVDSYTFDWIPHFGLTSTTWVGKIGAASLSESEFLMDSAEPLLAHKMLVQISTGETFEAVVDIHPEVTYRADLGSIPGNVVAVQLKNPTNHIVATVTCSVAPVSWPSLPYHNSKPVSPNWDELTDAQLLTFTSDPLLRVPAFIKLAARASLVLDFSRADACYEQALLFNADDPLLWWAKAVNRRLGGMETGDERTELLNAHFLAPLEPCLRAEAFLSQPQVHGKDPSPLLEPLNETPEVFIEVACQLIDAGFIVEAGRFIDEALRHVDFAMLNYLSAFLYLEYSKMEAQAAEHVMKGNLGLCPPFPYRATEGKAIETLRRRFPTDATLANRFLSI